MTNETRVAAVVAVRNGGDELLECLCSLLAQTLDDLEVIVADDVSTDWFIERAARPTNTPRRGTQR